MTGADGVAFTAKGVAATVLPHLNSQVVVLAEDPDGDGGPRLELSLRLDPRAQGALGVPEQVSIVLEADAAVVETVRLALIAILGAAGADS